MNKDKVDKWCKNNNYLLIKINGKRISDDDIMRLACIATKIPVGDITKKTNIPEYAFARYLAVGVFRYYYSSNQIMKILNMKNPMVWKAKIIMDTDPKFLAAWQREAKEYFFGKINEITNNINNE